MCQTLRIYFLTYFSLEYYPGFTGAKIDSEKFPDVPRVPVLLNGRVFLIPKPKLFAVSLPTVRNWLCRWAC